ncbi:MAG TPA: excinuclease ABC subunit C [Blastocatellia bacterium]|nr:excinuclease ABC subunit C [Blastocatellia bacterium]
MVSIKNKKPTVAKNRVKTSEPPFETRELRKQLSEFFRQPIVDPNTHEPIRLGACRFGVYAFFDYDGEPIYVGRTRESLGGRVGRHLTNQRTDAVAMNVLDPFEVCEIEVWPLAEYQDRKKDDKEALEDLNALEAAIFQRALRASKFNAVLNEKVPVSTVSPRSLPASIRTRVVSDQVNEIRGHPDSRIARRAATLARLAQVISERSVKQGLRRTLLTQAKRLEWLAEERIKPFLTTIEADDKKAKGGKD